AANYWLTCLTVDSETSGSSRDALIAALEVADIEARPLWKPLHLQPVFKDKICYGGELAAGLFKNGLCLPSGSGMHQSEREAVINTIKDTLSLGRSQ
ncbi:MAG: DegT/DnrJ/EryC1/StrS family aminotransferase, partial [Verrucomicrobiota bacterium]|nr:DegT/DnrJ/EryC1/StrS family aminotransferase [Verrucomicrobiota bacterium]